MVISDSQLETWSHQGKIQGSINAHESIRNCLSKYEFPEGVKPSIYLQGSYRNSTNIYSNSDVDVIVELDKPTFRPDKRELNDEQLKIYERKYSDATYLLSVFKTDVMNALRNCYDESNIHEGNKAIKLTGNGNRVDADIIVCIQFRYFWEVKEHSDDRYTQGIAFQKLSGDWIVSYPKQHYDNGCSKMNETNQNYKSTIRIYKNMKVRMINQSYVTDSLCSSYHIECLLYNVPNSNFEGDYYDRTFNPLNWLNENKDNFNDFMHQHNLYKLFGTGPDQWDTDSAVEFVNQMVAFWKDWDE